jgi:L-arabinokinase
MAARVGAFMGYSIIARQLGLTPEDLQAARQTQNRELLPFQGYLANIAVTDFEAHYLPLLPEKLTGEEFIDHYGTTIDAVTTVQPAAVYRVKACTAHPVYENNRVWRFRKIIEDLSAPGLADPAELLVKAGHLMYASHQSYSDCGLGDARTDELVALVKAAGPAQGLYGAKVTGGGSGGTVCILTYGDPGLAAAKEIHRHYCTQHGLQVLFFEGSSNGGYYS